MKSENPCPSSPVDGDYYGREERVKVLNSIQEERVSPLACMSIPDALQRLAKGRDPAAWEALLEQTGADIARVTRRITGDQILSEDACQETLLQIRDHAKNFKAPAAPGRANAAAKAWIVRIATFTALDMQRSRIRAQRREQNTMSTVASNLNPEGRTIRSSTP